MAERLNGETRPLTLPVHVPQAFVAVWHKAIQFAPSIVEQGSAEQMHVLDAERERIVAAEDPELELLLCLGPKEEREVALSLQVRQC